MAGTVDVAELIDQSKVGPYQWFIVALAWLTLFLDGMDNQSIAYVATALGHDWHLAKGAINTVFSLGVLGVAIGALVIGPLADSFGRKKVTVATVAYVGLLTLSVTQTPLIAAFVKADNLTVLADLRFLIGLGLGAAVPLGVVLVNEFAPRRRRAGMVTLMGCGYAIGAASGGYLASYLVPAFHWPAQFYVASALTLLMAVVLAFGLPESIRFLTVRGDTARVSAILRKIDPALVFPADTRFILRREGNDASAGGFRLVQLFAADRVAGTILIWLCLFMNTLALNYLNNWLPTLAVEAGLTTVQAARAAPMLQVGGIFGVITLGLLADRFGFTRVLATSFVLGGVCISLLGWVGGAFYPMVAAIFISGFFNIGTQITLGALAATLYPTNLRSTGVNWAHGMARVGSILSVQLAGTLLALHWPLQTMYGLVAIPLFLGALWMLLLGRVRHEGKGGGLGRESASIA